MKKSKLRQLIREEIANLSKSNRGVGLKSLLSKRMYEADDDKYTHIGFGKFKEKGKEDDEDAPTFKKDGEKFVPTGDAAASKDKSGGSEKKKDAFGGSSGSKTTKASGRADKTDIKKKRSAIDKTYEKKKAALEKEMEDWAHDMRIRAHQGEDVDDENTQLNKWYDGATSKLEKWHTSALNKLK